MAVHPTHLQANVPAAEIYLGVAAVFFCAALIACWWDGRRRGHALAFLALLGGAIASLEEAWIDTALIQLWYPLNSPAIAFTALGTPQPFYLHLIYPGFIGLGAYATYIGLLRHPDGRLLWPTFFGIMLMDLLFEGIATWFGIFYYYGHQPFQLFENGWPAWVAPINAVGPILGGWLMFKLRPQLQGVRTVLFALLPPLAYTGTYGATGWYVPTLMNSGVSELWIHFGAIVTVIECMFIISLIRRAA